MRIIAATGHRIPKLNLTYSDSDGELLFRFAKEHIINLNKADPIDKLISGMASGFDQAIAEVAIDLKIPLIAALPFLGMEWKWPYKAQDKFQAILKQAEQVEIVSPGEYSNAKYYIRDKWMVNNATEIIALYDEDSEQGLLKRSGTGLTVHYAREKGLHITNLWNEWTEYRDN